MVGALTKLNKRYIWLQNLQEKTKRISRQTVKKLAEQNIDRQVTRKEEINMNII